MRTIKIFRNLILLLLPLSFVSGIPFSIPVAANTQQRLFSRPSMPSGITGIATVDRFYQYIRTRQHQLTRQLAKSVRNLKSSHSPSAAYGLILASLLYGFFHAAGPGHGKAVISGYLLASRQSIRRGIALAFAASFVQAISAIVVVVLLTIIWKATGAKISQAIGGVTRLSYGLIVLAGADILWSTLRPSHPSSCSGHQHDGICTACGHAHMPGPEQLENSTSLKTMAAIVFTVGVRPCTGAVLMLILAFTHGILAAGLIATFAMSLGTAITVSILAALTVGMKQGLLRLFSGHTQMVDLITKGLGVAAGAFIIFVGLTLLLVTGPRPFI